MKKIKLILLIPIITVLLSSCNDNSLTDDDNILRDDISGRPVYEGLANDGLDFSIIPLVEGNEWFYSVEIVLYDFSSGTGELEEQAPFFDHYNLTCSSTFSEKDYRWFDMEVDKPVRFDFPFHTYDNNIQALSNREDGMYQQAVRGLNAFGDPVFETGTLLPYFPGNNGEQQLLDYEYVTMIVENDLSYTTKNGNKYNRLIRYRHRVDLKQVYEDLTLFPQEIYLDYDYYFDPEIGLIAFTYRNSMIDDLDGATPGEKEELWLMMPKSVDIELVHHMLIEI